jgi:predicted dehydrogenase
MKQIIQSYKTGEIKLVNSPAPTCAPGEVVVKNRASLVSVGTERGMIELGKKSLLGKALARPDLVKRFIEKVKNEGLVKAAKEAFGRLDTPTALGYSSAGIIVEVGEGISKYKEGDRISVMGPGVASHAEYIRAPQELITKIEDTVSFEEASFGTLGAIALHGINMTKVKTGDAIAVIGLGLLGLLTTQILKAHGFEVFGFDISNEKIALAKKVGIENATADQEEFREMAKRKTNGEGADAVIITASTSSKEPVDTAIEIGRGNARVVIVGVVDIHPNRQEVWEKEIEILVSKAAGPKDEEGRNHKEFLRLLAEKKVNVKALISHRFTIDEAETAYERVVSGEEGPYVGVILRYKEGHEPIQKETRTIKNPSAKPSTNEDISMGVIGAGVFGKALLIPALKKVKGIQLHTLATATSATAHHIGKKYGFRHLTTNYKEILENNEINAVMILSPHRLHAKMVIEALKAGKHVFVEKPLCVNERELEEIKEAYKKLSAERKPPILIVGYNRRFSPHAKRIKQFFAKRSDPLIAHYRINAGFVPREHWVHDQKEGGGRIIGEACHFIDFLQYVTGSNPVRVHEESISGNEKTALKSDNVAIVIKFEDGSIGSIVYTASGDRSFSRERIELFSEEKTATLTDFKKTVLFKRGRKKKYTTHSQELGHKEEIEHFVECVKRKTSTQLTPEEIFISTATTLEVAKSI